MHKWILAVFCLATNILAQTFTWQQTNGPVGGSVKDIALNGQSELFALDGENLFKTRTDQISWLNISKDINASMTTIAVNSKNALFVGTRKPHFGSEGRTGGIFGSTDNGESWFHTSQGLPDATINDLQVNSNDEIFAVTNNVISKSIDDGETWQAILDDSTGNWDAFETLAISPQDHIFVGTFGSGVLRSTDGGAHWAVINTGLEYKIINDFATSVSGAIYIGVRFGGVYRSRDNGNTWEEINNGLPNDSPTIGQIEVNSKGGLFASVFGNFYVSRDGGDLWTEVNNSEFIKHTSAIFVDELNEVYVGTFGDGVIRSNDDGLSWQPVNHGLANSWVTAFAVNHDDVLIAGTNGGLSFSENNGDTWQQLEQDLSSLFLSRMAISPNGAIFTGSSCPGDNSQFMLRSLDNGYTWTEMTQMRRCILSLVVAANEDILISTSFFIDGIYRSQDNGDSWEQLHPELVARALAVTQDNHIFAGTRTGFFRSDDDGQTWNLVRTPIQDARAPNLLIDSEDHIFAELTDYSSRSLYRSTDNGLTWKLLAFGIDDVTGVWRARFQINTLYQDGESNLWAGTSEGVYFSPDNGETWQLENLGLEEIEVRSFGMNSKGTLFAGTSGDGIFRISESVVSINSPDASKPGDFRLEQNYPNPFNPETTIRYQIQEESHVNLSIINLLGEKIRTLVDQDQAAGLYNIKWDGKDDFSHQAASGVYFYRLTSGSLVTVKRLLLIQ